MYLDWVRKNGGAVEKDESAQIKNAPVFLDLPPELTRAAELIEAKKWSQAFAALKKSKNLEDHFAKTLVNKVNANVAAHIALLEKQKSVGDVYGIYANFQKHSKSYKGIPAYDEVFKRYGSFFKDKANKAQLTVGREFHSIINRMNKMSRVSKAGLGVLEKFAKDHAETVHGKAAQKAFENISENSSLKQSAEGYYLE
jgi:ssDNA-specific exonuclease RecJ